MRRGFTALGSEVRAEDLAHRRGQMLYKRTAMRPYPFLSDRDVWVLYCAARLAELNVAGGGHESLQSLARRLHSDSTDGGLGPIAAAERYIAGAHQAAV